MLMLPTALSTHTEVSEPPDVAGARATMTRFATTAPAARLSVENGGGCAPVYAHVPFDDVGNTLRYVGAVPATPAMFSTAAATFVPGIASAPDPVTLTISGCPLSSAPCAWHGVDFAIRLVSHTRTGVIGWNSPVGSLPVSGSK